MQRSDSVTSLKIPVTVIIPTRNEEANLATCLQRLGFFDEVLVVDSCSTDATCQIAADHGSAVIQFEWNGRYPKKRNWVLLNHRLRNDWVLFLDADELVTTDFCREVSVAIQESRYVAFWLRYTNHFLGLLYDDCIAEPHRLYNRCILLMVSINCVCIADAAQLYNRPSTIYGM